MHAIKLLKDIKVQKVEGPWKSKSGAKIYRQFNFNKLLTEEFLHCDEDEMKELKRDIRGLRMYEVRDAPKDGIGGTEFHKIRHEMVITIEGSMGWRLEDIGGNIREIELKADEALIYIPNYVMHTYSALKNGTRHIAICNTIFDPNDKKTWDTYSLEIFKRVQSEIKLFG